MLILEFILVYLFFASCMFAASESESNNSTLIGLLIVSLLWPWFIVTTLFQKNNQMTNLSSAAQAILTVYGRATGDISCVWHPSELKGLAAALRAAARLNPGPFVPELFGEGWDAAMKALADIADELEGVKYGTYRCDLEKK